MSSRCVAVGLGLCIAAGVGSVLVSQPALALIRGHFRSVDELGSAHNLVVVRVPDRDPRKRPLAGLDGVMDFQVEVLSVLHGPQPANPRRTVVSTTTVLRPGVRYLLAGQPASRGGKAWLLFDWTLGVIEIPSDFSLPALKGKTPRDQVLAILRARRAAVLRQVRALQKEKRLLDRAISADAEEVEAGQATTRPGNRRR